jgi:16S rRNA G966 N2-methylase RsmD
MSMADARAFKDHEWQRKKLGKVQGGGQRKYARTFGQDLMRGEHKVGENLTRVKGARGEDLDEVSGKILAAQSQSGTSIFDPVLCELAYRWFCAPGGKILDPFAGGSVRGIVAAKLGRDYTGIDLRAEQVEANRAQAAVVTPDNPPTWIVGDSRESKTLAAGEYDFIFSCPPYGDLEVYSDDPNDLSAMDHAAFIGAYFWIIRAAVEMLKHDRFACFVVGDYRDKAGFYRNFVSYTIECFEKAGAKLYNEAILVTSLGSLPIRVGKQFESSRKLGKTHQNVLVFCKGDPKKATAAVGPVEVAFPNDND